ncbi:hypothetical protein Tco_1210289 [Tanacetum coccineum]
MMRETEVHKFSDGTLQRILVKLDHMVKVFKLYEYNPGMETRVWSKIDRRRSKEFMEVHVKMEMVSSCAGRDKFITACSYLTNTFKEIMKAQAYVSNLLFQDQEKYEHVGPQVTRPQDGERSQDDDQRLDLADDLMKAPDHISSLNTSHKTKTTTSKYKISSEESKTTS